MEPVWKKNLGEKLSGFRSKLETQRIQLDFDDLRLKHLIEVSESIRLYTTEYGYPIEDLFWMMLKQCRLQLVIALSSWNPMV